MVFYEDQDKWPSNCGMCGTTKEELIIIQNKIEKVEMKLEDWIEPYGIDVHGDGTYETDNKPVAYNIPSYKIDRLKEADESANLLDRYKVLGTPEEIHEALSKGIETLKSDELIIVFLMDAIKKARPSMLPKTQEYFDKIIKTIEGPKNE